MALKVGELYASFGIDSKGVSKDISSINKQCTSIGKGLAITGAALSASITKPVVSAAKDIIKTGANFDYQMSRVKAISGATEEEFKGIRKEALRMAAGTSFTAQQTGEALEYMGMAGWKADQMVAGLPAILDLAAASGEDLGTVSDIVTDALTAFGLKAEDASMFADVLAAASTSANTNVGMMGQSFKYVAPLAGSMGYSIQDMAVALGLMANAGIKSTQAGTSLRTIISNMQSPTESQAIAMEKLGLSLYDARGGVKSFSTVMKEMRQAARKAGVDTAKLHDVVKEYDKQLAAGTLTQDEYDAKLSELTKGSEGFMKAVTDLAGARGLSAMLAIMNTSDEEFDKLTAAIRDSKGEAHSMADEMLDNLYGDFVKFNSALDVTKINLSDLLSGSLRPIVQGATDYVNAFRDMDDGTKMLTIKLAGLAAAAGPVTAAVGGMIAGLPKVAPALRTIVSPAGIAAGALALFAIAAVDADNKVGTAFEGFAASAAENLNASQGDIEAYISMVSGRIPALASSITQGIGTLVPALIGTAGTVVSGFIKMIGDNADAVSGIGVEFVSGIVGSIASEIEKHDMVAEAGTMLTKLGAALIKGAPKLINSATHLATALLNGFSHVDFGENAKTLTDALTEAAGEIDMDAFGELGEALLGAIAHGIEGAIDGAATLASGLGKALSAAVSGEGFTGLDGFSESILKSIAAFDFSSMSVQATAIATKLVNAIGTALKTGLSFGGILIDALGTVLSGDFGTSLVGSAKQIATNIIMAIAGQIPTLTATATTVIKSLGNLIKDIPWSEAGSAISDIATSLIDALKTAILGTDEMEGVNMDGLVDAIANGISNAADGISAAASALIAGLIKYFDAHGEELVEAGGKLAWSVAKGAIQVGGTLAKGVANVINTGIAALKGETYDPVVEAARDSFMTLNGRIPRVYESTIGNITGGQIVENLSAPFRDKNSWDRALASWGAMVESGASEYFPEFSWYGNEAAIQMFDGLSGALKNGDTDQAIEQAALVYASGFNKSFTKDLKNSNRTVYNGMNELLTGSIELVNLSKIADKQGYDLGKALGVNIPDGVEIGVKEGVAGLQIGEDWFPAFGTLASGYDLSTMLSENWYAAFATSLDGLGDYQNELTAALESMGVTAIGAMNIDVPEGFGDFLAEQIANGTLSVEGAAEELLSLVFGYKTELQSAFEGLEGDGALDSVANSASTAASAASAEVQTAMDEMANASQAGLAGISQAVSQGQTEAQQAASQVQASVVEAFLANMSEANGQAIGATWIAGIVAGMSTGDLVGSASATCSAASAAASAALSGAASLGMNFALGIANGIRSGSGEIIRAAQDAAIAAYNAACHTLQIGSPSKLGDKKIGRMWDAGIARGMDNNIGVISDAASRVRDVLMDQQYIGEPSRNTVHTARQTAQETEQAITRATSSRAQNGGQDGGGKTVHVELKLNDDTIAEAFVPIVDDEMTAELKTSKRR